MEYGTWKARLKTETKVSITGDRESIQQKRTQAPITTWKNARKNTERLRCIKCFSNEILSFSMFGAFAFTNNIFMTYLYV